MFTQPSEHAFPFFSDKIQELPVIFKGGKVAEFYSQVQSTVINIKGLSSHNGFHIC